MIVGGAILIWVAKLIKKSVPMERKTSYQRQLREAGLILENPLDHSPREVDEAKALLAEQMERKNGDGYV